MISGPVICQGWKIPEIPIKGFHVAYGQKQYQEECGPCPLRKGDTKLRFSDAVETKQENQRPELMGTRLSPQGETR
jgi:hypothetical protein